MLRNSRSWAAEEQNSAGDVLNSGLGPVGKTKPYNIARVRGTQRSITASSCAVSGHITSQQKKITPKTTITSILHPNSISITNNKHTNARPTCATVPIIVTSCIMWPKKPVNRSGT